MHVDDLADLYRLAPERAPADGRTVAWPLQEARQKLGACADALVLDQQATGRRAQELLGWRPLRPAVLEDIERGSYAKTPLLMSGCCAPGQHRWTSEGPLQLGEAGRPGGMRFSARPFT